MDLSLSASYCCLLTSPRLCELRKATSSLGMAFCEAVDNSLGPWGIDFFLFNGPAPPEPPPPPAAALRLGGLTYREAVRGKFTSDPTSESMVEMVGDIDLPPSSLGAKLSSDDACEVP